MVTRGQIKEKDDKEKQAQAASAAAAAIAANILPVIEKGNSGATAAVNKLLGNTVPEKEGTGVNTSIICEETIEKKQAGINTSPAAGIISSVRASYAADAGRECQWATTMCVTSSSAKK